MKVLNYHLLVLGCILFSALYFVNAKGQEKKGYDPCCSFPCQNFGICTRIGFSDRYTCDCYNTGRYGDNCEKQYWSSWIADLIQPSPYTVNKLTTYYKYFWKFINSVGFLHSSLMAKILQIKALRPPWPEAHNTFVDYTTWDGYANKTYYALTLPPVPKNCPTPLGIAGPKVLPDTKKVVEKIFTRTEFKPCPRGTTVLTPLYGQHFTHQGFKSLHSDHTLSWSEHSIDGAHIYGETLEKQFSLRTMKGGKMKMQMINGEKYPPPLKQCPGIKIKYPPEVDEKHKFAMAHPFFAKIPSLLYYTTLWLREHNRVCGILAEQHPDWDDERLFQTTRLIIIGEILKVTVESYVQHFGGMHLQLTYEPNLLHETPMPWSSNRIHVEFNTVYHWHNMMPDYFKIGDKNYSIVETYYNMDPLLDHGMNVFTTSLSNQLAGRGAGGRNMHKSLHPVAIRVLEMNRKVRLQPFNRYRQSLHLPPYKTFEELTGETKLARVLSELYEGDIDGVEFFVGVMVEKRHDSKVWGLTLNEAISSYSMRSIFSNTIGSPSYWRESTFGGKVGFDIVKTTTLEDLVCRNIEGCPKIRFQMEEAINEDQAMVYNDIEFTETKKKNTKTEL
ncbi:prostaglandin G/H synthase 2-like [Styela clava]